MRVLLTVLCVSMIPAAGFSKDIHVPGGAATIQDGIDAAGNGDTVLVHPGTYPENINFKGKAITVRGGGGAAMTFIDGNQAGSVVTFESGEGPDSIFTGFTVFNGKAAHGGGIKCIHTSSPTIAGNVVTENRASDFGGGIYCNRSSPFISDNSIFKNAAIVEGSGGGGIACMDYSDPVIENNRIFKNRVGCQGGAVHCEGHSNPKITNNLIYENVFVDPTPDDGYGGAVNACFWSAPVLTNNVIYKNYGFLGGAVSSYWYSEPVIRNCILWANKAVVGKEIWVHGSLFPSALTISYSDVEGGMASAFVDPGSQMNWGAGMIDGDPEFVAPEHGDFHICHSSPCMDSGDNHAVERSDQDFEGDPRIAYGTVDMGADEFYTHLYCLGDPNPGGHVALQFVGIPGVSPVQLWLGSGVMDPPLQTKYGGWYLQYPLLAAVPNLGAIPFPDGVLELPLTLPPGIPTPISLPFQAGLGAELTNCCLVEVN